MRNVIASATQGVAFILFAVGVKMMGYSWFQAISAASLFCYALEMTFRYTRARRALDRIAGFCEIKPPDLNKQEGRDALDAFLINQRIIGSANVRNGRVHRIVSPRELPEVVRKLRVVIEGLSDGRLPAPFNLYRAVKRHGEGTGWAYEVVDLSLSDLAEFTAIVERVAEDRRQSVQLYNGITDEETLAIARTVAASRLRKGGDFDTAALVLKGTRDDHEAVQIACSTVDLIFKIKGANL